MGGVLSELIQCVFFANDTAVVCEFPVMLYANEEGVKMPVILITGASSGFGRLTALAFARQGDTVYAAMRDLTKAYPLQDEAAANNLQVNLLELDVTDTGVINPGQSLSRPSSAFRQIVRPVATTASRQEGSIGQNASSISRLIFRCRYRDTSPACLLYRSQVSALKAF